MINQFRPSIDGAPGTQTEEHDTALSSLFVFINREQMADQ